MSISKFLTLPRKGAGYCTTLVALAILAAPSFAWAQTCSPFQDVQRTPEGPFKLGTTVRVQYLFGAETITGGTLNFDEVNFALDCIDAETSQDRENCLGFVNTGPSDDGDAILYAGNLTSSSLTGTVCDGVTFTADSAGTAASPQAIPNSVTFTANAPLQFSTGERCEVAFDILVNSYGDNLETPPDAQIVRGAAGFDGQCENGLGANPTSSVAYLFDIVPDIDILKEVSIDGGATWYDANVDAPPADMFPIGLVPSTLAQYRLTVENIGEEALINVVLNDATLGLVNEPLPTRCEPFEPGDMCVIDSGE